jgi:hypothetical protein
MPYGSVNADLMTTSDGVSSSGLYGFKNRLINSAMVIDQRNAGASVTVNSTTQTFSVDRWWASGQATDGVFTMQQTPSATETGYATRVGAGFTNYLGVTVTTADTSIGATQRYYLAQRIEAFNTADLAWGTANAKTVTLSAWVYSSLTGTFGGFIYNSAADYSYPFTYSIPVANTWTQISVTIAGPTAGTWLGATNGIGMQIGWSLGAGSTNSGTAGSWASAQYFGATGQTNVIGTNSATFYITGVQLEKGSTATSFDYRPYGTELQLCQRYFAKLSAGGASYTAFGVARGNGGSSVFAYLKYPTTMRSAPTTVQSNTGVNFPSQASITAITATYDGLDSSGVEMSTSATVGAGICALWNANNNGAAFVTLSAEL